MELHNTHDFLSTHGNFIFMLIVARFIISTLILYYIILLATTDCDWDAIIWVNLKKAFKDEQTKQRDKSCLLDYSRVAKPAEIKWAEKNNGKGLVFVSFESLVISTPAFLVVCC